MAKMAHLCSCFLRFKYRPDEIHQMEESKRIDKMLKKEKRFAKRQVRLLLLGAGDSGKSTFLKQMKIIHGYQFSDELVLEYRNTIYQNTVRGMKVLVDAREKLSIPWEDSLNADHANIILSYQNYMRLDAELFSKFSPSINLLWHDKAIITAYERRREFQLGDSVEYFFNNIDIISSENYMPSNQDILFARQATKSIDEFFIDIKRVPFCFIDIGGQRSQRQKWLSCFEAVTSILFMVSSSEYDQVLFEDRLTNRLAESLNIFETIVNNRYFNQVSIILFLNKTDLLKSKLEKGESNIKKFFPNFSGDPLCLKDVQHYLIETFEGVRRNKRPPLYHHFTTAIDTNNIKRVFDSVKETILEKHIQQLMLH